MQRETMDELKLIVLRELENIASIDKRIRLAKVCVSLSGREGRYAGHHRLVPPGRVAGKIIQSQRGLEGIYKGLTVNQSATVQCCRGILQWPGNIDRVFFFLK